MLLVVRIPARYTNLGGNEKQHFHLHVIKRYYSEWFLLDTLSSSLKRAKAVKE